MKLDEVPWQIWVFLGGQFVTFVYVWGRALQSISLLKKENEKQNDTITSMYDKVSATREDVAEIKGILGSRTTD